MTTPPPPRSRTHVEAFARGLEVIACFGRGAERLSLGEVAARTGLDRAVARRLLLTLVGQGYMTAEAGRYRPTARMLRLGQAYLGAAGFGPAFQPALQALSARIDENASLTVLDVPEIVHVARAEAPARLVRHVLTTDARMPAFATASGRVLLAALPDEELRAVLAAHPARRHTPATLVDDALLAAIVACRAEDGAVVDGELEAGYVSAAVPLRDRAGRVMAAVATSSHTARMDAAALRDRILPALRDAAAEMTALLP